MANWANINYNGKSVGTAYTEGDDNFGFVVTTDPEAVEGYGIINKVLTGANDLPIKGADLYNGLLAFLDKNSSFSYEEGEGELTPPESDLTGLREANSSEYATPYYLIADNDGNVVRFYYSSPEGPQVRASGEWVSDADSEFDEPEDSILAQVDEAAVAIYDKIVSENQVPTLEDFEVVPFDD